MRARLLGLLVFAACAPSYGDSPDEAPAPLSDASVASNDAADAAACVPVVVTPEAPPPCAADLASDAMNCGTCGHACVDSSCAGGRCAAERVSEPVDALTVDGTTAYAFASPDVLRADTTKATWTYEQFFAGFSGIGRRMEVFGPDLYVSTSAEQVIVSVTTKLQRVNSAAADATSVRSGRFYPGAVSYYLFDDPAGGQSLARIGGGATVEYKKAASFLPIARTGNDLYWTQPLADGDAIFGPWDRADTPVVKVGAPIESFAATGDTLFFAAGGFVSRAGRTGGTTNIAVERGSGVAFATDGDTLFYATRRETPAEVRYFVMRVDACRGGTPVLLFDVNVPVRGLFLLGNDHVLIDTEAGVFKTRR